MMHEAIASHRPIDVLEPLAGMQGAFACSPNALSSWIMTAGTGRQCIYARAGRLSGSLAERARLLARGGSIQIAQRRNADDRTMFDYLATRTARPIVIPPAAIEQMSAFAIEVYDLLERVAAQSLRCPTNPQIGAALGGVAAHRVKQAIGQLRDANLIEVINAATGGDQDRTIRIHGSGAVLSRDASRGVSCHG